MTAADDINNGDPPSIARVTVYGTAGTHCNYCSGDGEGRWAFRARIETCSPEHYQVLSNRGWRRSGNLFYQPCNMIACCPQYSIRLLAKDYKPRRSHRKILSRFRKFLAGELKPTEAGLREDDSGYDVMSNCSNEAVQSKLTEEKQRLQTLATQSASLKSNMQKVFEKLRTLIIEQIGTPGDNSPTLCDSIVVRANQGKKAESFGPCFSNAGIIVARINKKGPASLELNGDAPKNPGAAAAYLAKALNSDHSLARIGIQHASFAPNGMINFTSDELMECLGKEADLKNQMAAAKDKILELENELKTSSKAVSNGKVNKRGISPELQSLGEDMELNGTGPASLNMISMDPSSAQPLPVRSQGINGTEERGSRTGSSISQSTSEGLSTSHVYSQGSDVDSQTSDAFQDANSQFSDLDRPVVDFARKHTFSCETVPATFNQESYKVYCAYQRHVHGDSDHHLSTTQYTKFLVHSPLAYVNACHGGAVRYGTFHRIYRVDGEIMAVGVWDLLPECLSSVYLYYDPRYSFLSPGVLTAIMEIEHVKELNAKVPSLQYYQMGYYIHRCPKMRYKGLFEPSQLLCPVTYQWVMYEKVKPLLDKYTFCCFADPDNTDQHLEAAHALAVRYLDHMLVSLRRGPIISFGELSTVIRISDAVRDSLHEDFKEYVHAIGWKAAAGMFAIDL
eukprot:Clim_evm52s251 gene=Clim_evmTU52s251